MSESIADRYPTIEYFTALDWENLLSLGKSQAAIKAKIAAKSPYLLNASTLPVPVFWAFSKESMIPNALQLIDDIPIFSGLGFFEISKLFQREYFSRLTEFIGKSGPHSSLDLILDRFVVSKNIARKFTEKNLSFEKVKTFLVENYTGNWMEFDSMWFFYLHAIDNNVGKDWPSLEQDVTVFLTNFYDFTLLKNSVRLDIPWPKVAQLCYNDPSRFAQIFFNPHDFTVGKTKLEENFLWPWQRSMRLEPELSNRIVLKEIPTTSIVGDLRFSTVAMGQFDPPEAYASFLDEVKLSSHRHLLASGAYFDKETGDGFVAHYCSCQFESDDWGNQTIAKEIEAAVVAGGAIISDVFQIFEKYKRHLKQGLSHVQMSIGIHSESAVWLCDSRQVRAIGPSVVRASRLCNIAKPMEIVISNRCYYQLIESGSRVQAEFDRIPVDIKELDQASGTYAHRKSYALMKECNN